jgi:hypothetical protein
LEPLPSRDAAMGIVDPTDQLLAVILLVVVEDDGNAEIVARDTTGAKLHRRDHAGSDRLQDIAGESSPNTTSTGQRIVICCC